jgi:hypothetical protein
VTTPNSKGSFIVIFLYFITNFPLINFHHKGKPHFLQLFASKGNYDSGFGKQSLKDKWESKGTLSTSSSRFNIEKESCVGCGKTVYPIEKITVDDKLQRRSYHKGCFRCLHCKSVLDVTNYVCTDGYIYCKPHFKELFATKGNLAFLGSETSKTLNEQSASNEPTLVARRQSISLDSSKTLTRRQSESQEAPAPSRTLTRRQSVSIESYMIETLTRTQTASTETSRTNTLTRRQSDSTETSTTNKLTRRQSAEAPSSSSSESSKATSELASRKTTAEEETDSAMAAWESRFNKLLKKGNVDLSATGNCNNSMCT